MARKRLSGLQNLMKPHS